MLHKQIGNECGLLSEGIPLYMPKLWWNIPVITDQGIVDNRPEISYAC
jgi:hypothetical protein